MNDLITIAARIKLSERNRKSGFTLVEVLIVMVIIASMGGMIVAAVQGVTTTAREARTKQIIAACDAVIQEQYDSYKYRPLPVVIPTVGNPTGSVGLEVLATEAARTRLFMTRDLMRMEMPDRLSDIKDPAVRFRGAASLVREVGSLIVRARHDMSQRTSFDVDWFNGSMVHVPSVSGSGGDDLPAKLAAYRNRIPRYLPSPPAATATTPFQYNGVSELKNQGAECLYLIMATSFVAGTPAIESIPAANIGDTDNDGLYEILDGWGNPLGFIRWPIGYSDPEQSLTSSAPDDFDLFRADFAYQYDETPSVVPAPSAQVSGVPQGVTTTLKPYSLRPLIISSGADGEFGIAINPWASPATSATDEIQDFSYASTTGSPTNQGASDWIIDEDHMGTKESQGRTGVFRMMDPYLRRFIALNGGLAGFDGLVPGQQLKSSGARESLTDNITNYQLQVR